MKPSAEEPFLRLTPVCKNSQNTAFAGFRDLVHCLCTLPVLTPNSRPQVPCQSACLRYLPAFAYHCAVGCGSGGHQKGTGRGSRAAAEAGRPGQCGAGRERALAAAQGRGRGGRDCRAARERDACRSARPAVATAPECLAGVCVNTFCACSDCASVDQLTRRLLTWCVTLRTPLWSQVSCEDTALIILQLSAFRGKECPDRFCGVRYPVTYT